MRISDWSSVVCSSDLLSRIDGSASQLEEKRSFVAEFAGSIWYGDVMHGPAIPVAGRQRKVYLVSLMDDASRLITHGAFFLGETAPDIEGVLQQRTEARAEGTGCVSKCETRMAP